MIRSAVILINFRFYHTKQAVESLRKVIRAQSRTWNNSGVGNGNSWVKVPFEFFRDFKNHCKVVCIGPWKSVINEIE